MMDKKEDSIMMVSHGESRTCSSHGKFSFQNFRLFD